MGAVLSSFHTRFLRGPDGLRRRPGARRTGGEDGEQNEIDIYSNCESGGRNYFGSHFLMAGEKHELARPEASLFFVENKELDQLGDRPVSFPYQIGKQASDIVHPLNVYVNVRKESVKIADEEEGEETRRGQEKYRIEFMFDADRAGFIQLHFDCNAINNDRTVLFQHRGVPSQMQSSKMFHFNIGADQVFNEYVFEPATFDMNKMQYRGGNFFPVVIALHTEGTDAQVQTTECTIESTSDSTQSLILKLRRQKICVDGVFYLLQELFGIENKESSAIQDEHGFECNICLTDVRDTVILPCRHVCLCHNCADALRIKVSNCPICRKPFRALLKLSAHKKVNPVHVVDPHSGNRTRSQNKIEYHLVEVLNGPLTTLGSSTSIANEIVDETEPKRRSTRSRGLKVVGKKGSDEARETPDGIEMSEYFMHRPVNVVVVKPAPKKEARTNSTTSTTNESLPEQSVASSEESEVPPPPSPDAQTKAITSDPSSTDSQDSSNALLKKEKDNHE